MHLSCSIFLSFDNSTTFYLEDDMKILVNTGLKSVYKGLMTESKEGHKYKVSKHLSTVRQALIHTQAPLLTTKGQYPVRQLKTSLCCRE